MAREPFDTNPPGHGDGGILPGALLYRMRVKESPFAQNPMLMRCRMWNGTVEGAQDYIVATGRVATFGSEVLVTTVIGGTSHKHGGREVVYRDLGGTVLPSPTKLYQVYTPIDATLVPIWTWLRVH